MSEPCPRCGQYTLGAPCQCARGASAPAFDAPRLFDAPATIRGQLAMDTPAGAEAQRVTDTALAARAAALRAALAPAADPNLAITLPGARAALSPAYAAARLPRRRSATMIVTKAQIAALAALTGGRGIPATTPFDVEQRTTLGALHVEHIDGRRWIVDAAGTTTKIEEGS